MTIDLLLLILTGVFFGLAAVEAEGPGRKFFTTLGSICMMIAAIRLVIAELA